MTVTAIASGDPVPLVVNVNGTLLRTDILGESALQFVARHPLEGWRIVEWLSRGKTALKGRLADHVDPGVDAMPLREEVVALIRDAQAEGRPVYMASASDRRLVQALADRVGGVAGVFAVDPGARGPREAAALEFQRAFGAGNYDYVADSPRDLSAWRNARRVLVVAHDPGLEARVRREVPDAEIVARPRPQPSRYLAAMRPHQWAKNLLLFLSVITGHHFDLRTLFATLLAFCCFCAAASSAYILNDLLDLPGDRDHPRKSKRPFAAGEIPLLHGVAMVVVLMAGAFLAALALPIRFIIVLLVYVVATISYSLVLKRRVILDVITLGGLYSLRVLAGLAAGNAKQAALWLLMFSLFLFLSLALVKRCSELGVRRAEGKEATMGRGYRVVDLAVLFPLAAAAGYAAVLVVTLYLSSPDVIALYAHPRRMWLVCPILLYWISRILILANRGELHDDPVVFAITDRVSLVTGALAAAVVAVSL